MKQFEIRSEHSPEIWLKLWDRRVVQLNSKNKAAYSGEKCFFGTKEDGRLMVYFHKDYDNAYLTTRFMGQIEKDGSGSKITGTIGKMKSAIMFLWFMFFAMGIGGICMIVLGQYQQAIPLFVLALIGLYCVKSNPQDSVTRLERLLTVISNDIYDEDDDAEIPEEFLEHKADEKAESEDDAEASSEAVSEEE